MDIGILGANQTEDLELQNPLVAIFYYFLEMQKIEDFIFFVNINQITDRGILGTSQTKDLYPRIH